MSGLGRSGHELVRGRQPRDCATVRSPGPTVARVEAYWNTAATARLALLVCERKGVPTQPILAGAGIDPEVIDDPAGRVSFEQMQAFWREAVLQSGDPAIGLHTGSSIPRGAYGILDYLVGYSSTIGEGLQRLAEYIPTINTWLTMRSEVDRHTGRLWLDGVVTRPPRPSAEFVAALVVGLGHRTWQLDFAPKLVRFEFDRPEPPEPSGEHAVALGCEVQFGAPRTEIVLDRETWEVPVRASDPGLIALLEKQAHDLIAHLPESNDFVDSVRRVVEGELAGGDMRLESIAGELAMSGRTLQRRLAADDLSFAELVDEVRLEAAKIRIINPRLSLTEVAYLVGFDEQSSFSRAFKRWTGLSPRDYRRQVTTGSRPTGESGPTTC